MNFGEYIQKNCGMAGDFLTKQLLNDRASICSMQNWNLSLLDG